MKREELYTQFDATFFEKTRLSMLTLLYDEKEVSFSRFRVVLGGTDGSVYAHIQKLISAGYIAQKKAIENDKLQTRYTLTSSGRAMFRRYLDFIETMLHLPHGGST